MGIGGVLLDIDGVLAVSWEPIPGAVDALAWLRGRGTPFRLITNTTTHTRENLASTLRSAGFEVDASEIVTAVVATASYLRANHPGARVLVISDGDALGDFEDVDVVDLDEEADVVVIGGASDAFTYHAMNRAFDHVMGGAALVGMHRNLYWRTTAGLQLDGGAYLAGLEEAAGVRATICGKPSGSYFQAALDRVAVPASSVVMVGDDIVNDVEGAMAAGMKGVLVRTGKFLPTDLERGRPDFVLDSIADLPAWLQAQG
jgi:HAD superfamily hydrolase (TIGR01458 family)